MGRIKITDLYIYPIKSLRPLSVPTAQLRREGLRYDRRFMLLKVEADGKYRNIQTVHFPECTLFYQTLEFDEEGENNGHIVVTYRIPDEPLLDPPPPEQRTSLRVPLYPAVDGLEGVDIRLYRSPTTAHRMGDQYDAWFSACFGYPVILVYIGENRRPVLAHTPKTEPLPQEQEQEQEQNNSKSWFSTITSFIPSSQTQTPAAAAASNKGETNNHGLTFNEAAPFLVTSKASLRDVSTQLPEGEEMEMIKFRPNIVVDEVSDAEEDSGYEEATDNGGESSSSALEAWDEDYWGELQLGGSSSSRRRRLALTANCGRCRSINIDYATGRPALGETGAVLKKLMAYRRVDRGNKWSPVFGRYAFLLPPSTGSDSGEEEEDEDELVADVAVGDEVKVIRKLSERDVWAWPN
ncbi:hypothetical protein M426DRAFT_19349 [Hypoxylon sp. CI-4A]|nr:hypothetical protein M426DRAFT_19349 [Hypoxylon sp. CI-4A]